MFHNKPSDAELERRREVLRAREVPEAFIENLATRRDTVLAWRFMPTIILLASIAAVVPAGLAIRWQMDSVVMPGLAALYGRGALLASFGRAQEFAILPAFIGLMILPLCLFQLLVSNPAPYPAADMLASNLRRMQPREEKAGRVEAVPQSILRTAASAEDLIRGYNRKSLNLMAAILVPLVLAGIVAYFVLAGHYWAVMPDRIVSRGFDGEQTYLFKDAASVSVGCNHADDDNDIKYVVHFKDKSFDLPRADGRLESAEMFHRLETIDATLRRQGVPYRRWQWNLQNPMSPTCLSYWAAEAGANGKTHLSQLLSVP